MSFCSHQMLDWRPDVQLYQCRDCPTLFEARRISAEFEKPTPTPEPTPVVVEKTEVKESGRASSLIVAVGVAGILLLAALAVFYKLSKSGVQDRNPIPVCADTSEIEQRAEDAERALKVCLDRPPQIKEVIKWVDKPKICPKIPIIKPTVCPKSYKGAYQRCMADSGQKTNRIRRKDAKIAELRALLSKRVKEGGQCGNQTVHVPNRGCKDEIEAACGHLRKALDFYWGRQRKQDKTTDPNTDGLSPWQGEPYDEDDPDKDVEEPEMEDWDDEIEEEY